MKKLDFGTISAGLDTLQNTLERNSGIGWSELVAADAIDFAEKNTYAADDTNETIRELADQIEVAGLLSPLGVIKEGNRYRLFSGERRYRAITTYLHWEKIPCQVFEGVSANKAQLMLHMANASREYSPARKLELYEEYNALLRQMKENGEFSGGVQKGVAELLNVSDRQVRTYRTTDEPEVMQLSLFPSEQEQIRIIDEAAEIVPPISAFSFSQEEIDNVLRLGSNTEHHRERIVAAFEEQKSIDEIADILKNLYHGGSGIASVTAWYAEDGIHLSHKQSARYDKSAQVISWESAAERIGQLLKDGQFATNVELAEAEGYERKILAEQLWGLRHDLSDEAREAGYLKSLEENPRHGFPEESAWLAERLKSPEFRQRLEAEYAAFLTGYRQDRGLLCFHYHRPEETGEALKDLSLPRITFSSERTEIPTVKQFITEDEINTALSNGSGVSGGKGRIFSFFQENHTDKEKADFLKHEYGIGGRSHALSRAGSSWEDYDGKGLGYRKEGCTDVLFTWEKVAKRISNLIQQGRYFTEEEQAEYDKIQEEKALAEADEIVDVNQEADAPVPAYDLCARPLWWEYATCPRSRSGENL